MFTWYWLVLPSFMSGFMCVEYLVRVLVGSSYLGVNHADCKMALTK